MHPFDFITWFDVLILHIAALLKLLVEYNTVDDETKAKHEVFVFSTYLKDKWDNWMTHYVSMWLMILMLPQLVDFCGESIPLPFLKEIKSNSVNVIFTAAIGFFGYDAVKWVFSKISKKAV